MGVRPDPNFEFWNPNKNEAVPSTKTTLLFLLKLRCVFLSQIYIFFLNYRPYKEVTCLEEDLKKAILLNNENMEREWMKGVK